MKFKCIGYKIARKNDVKVQRIVFFRLRYDQNQHYGYPSSICDANQLCTSYLQVN